MAAKKTLILTAGGTGGHVFPALATAEACLKHGVAVTFITDARGKKYIPQQTDITVKTLAVARFGGSVADRIKAPLLLIKSFLQSVQILRNTKPSAVVGFGGYPAFPAALAAWILGIPVILHEQNAVVGRSNRWLLKIAAKIALTYEKPRFLTASAEKKSIVIGNPVRAIFHKISYTPPTDSVHLLVLGGSQGASIFSHVIPEALGLLPQYLLQKIHITQQARPEDIIATQQKYAEIGIKATVSAFFDNVPDLLAAAHLVIARSGASTCAEIMAVGRPSILVPYLHAKDDHQTANAIHLVRKNAAWMLAQTDFTAQSLAELLAMLLEDADILTRAATNAAQAAPEQAAEKLATLALGL
jgi:UDP-N-acetylglucosamine--N-acetylmuramyl-(pentapeptide) pyrophosphoryl-undecaprenol N-acetylglucosamine transferase